MQPPALASPSLSLLATRQRQAEHAKEVSRLLDVQEAELRSLRAQLETTKAVSRQCRRRAQWHATSQRDSRRRVRKAAVRCVVFALSAPCPVQALEAESERRATEARRVEQLTLQLNMERANHQKVLLGQDEPLPGGAGCVRASWRS